MSSSLKLRKCRRCGERKPQTEFFLMSGEPSPNGAYCEPCFKIREQEIEDEYRLEIESKLRKFKIIYGDWWQYYCTPHEFSHEIYKERDFCPYCGDSLPPEYLGDHPELGSFKGRAHLDHMDPLSLGGEDSIRNVVYVCDECNYKKRDMPFLGWLALLRADQRKLCRNIYESKHGHPPEEFRQGEPTARSDGTFAELYIDEEELLLMYPEPCVSGPPGTGNTYTIILDFADEDDEPIPDS